MYATRLASQKGNRTTLQSRPALGIRHWVGCFLSGGEEIESSMSSGSDFPMSKGPIKIYQMMSDPIENSPSKLSLAQ